MKFHRPPVLVLVLVAEVRQQADEAGREQQLEQRQLPAMVGYVSTMKTTTPCLMTSPPEQLDLDNTVPHDFTVRATGPQQLLPRNSAPIDYFLLLSTIVTMQGVLLNTREYAAQVMNDMAGWIARHPSSRLRRWSLDDINMTSLKRYLGLCMNTGLLQKKNVAWYWSKKFISQSTPFFAAVTPFCKFQMIQRFLHVGALDTPARGQPGFDPWSKVRPVLDSVNLTFKKYFGIPHNMYRLMRVWWE